MSSQGSEKTVSSSTALSGKDLFWEYGEKTGDKGSGKVTCKFCNQMMSGGVTRLKQHLAGQRGNCAPCPKVPEDVKLKANDAILVAKSVKEAKNSKLASERESVVIGDDDDEVELFSQMKTKGPMDKHVFPSPDVALDMQKKGKGKQVTMNDVKWKKQAREDACSYIARWFYEGGIPFNTVSLPSFSLMLEAIGQCGPGLKGPSPYELGEKYLQKEVDRTNNMLSSFRESYRITGCSLLTDAWTDRKGRSIMNLVVHCEAGTAFISSKNTSADVHDGKFIYEFVDKAIVDDVGEENVVQVVTDNASNNMAAARFLEMKRPTIFWTCCAAHTINLMLGDIGRIKPIKNAITMGRTLTVFFGFPGETLTWKQVEKAMDVDLEPRRSSRATNVYRRKKAKGVDTSKGKELASIDENEHNCPSSSDSPNEEEGNRYELHDSSSSESEQDGERDMDQD